MSLSFGFLRVFGVVVATAAVVAPVVGVAASTVVAAVADAAGKQVCCFGPV